MTNPGEILYILIVERTTVLGKRRESLLFYLFYHLLLSSSSFAQGDLQPLVQVQGKASQFGYWKIFLIISIDQQSGKLPQEVVSLLPLEVYKQGDKSHQQRTINFWAPWKRTCHMEVKETRSAWLERGKGLVSWSYKEIDFSSLARAYHQQSRRSYKSGK